MTTKAKALAVASRYGFVLDETNSGKIGDVYTAIFDHPTHSLGRDCRSITESSYPPNAAAYVWGECIKRMEIEGRCLRPCDDPECEYHHEEKELPNV